MPVLELAAPVVCTDNEPAAANGRQDDEWLSFDLIARRFPPALVCHVLTDEAALGRVEVSGDRVRLVRGAFVPAVVAALAALEVLDDVARRLRVSRAKAHRLAIHALRKERP